MEGKYEIHYRGEVVGQASVETKGLYYCFFCSVKLQKKELYRLWVIQNDKKTNLGICMPDHDRYLLVKKIPIKQFKQEKMTFVISDGHDNEKFFPIKSLEPFDNLSNLEKGRLVYKDGIPGVIFPSD